MDWDAKDIALLTGALGATYADVRSTQQSLDEGGEELNPLLGSHPSKERILLWNAIASIGGIAAANALPKKYRKGFLGAWLGMESRLAHQIKRRKEYSGFADSMKKPALAGLAAGLLAHHFLNDEESGVSVGPGALGPMSIKVQKKF